MTGHQRAPGCLPQAVLQVNRGPQPRRRPEPM